MRSSWQKLLKNFIDSGVGPQPPGVRASSPQILQEGPQKPPPAPLLQTETRGWVAGVGTCVLGSAAGGRVLGRGAAHGLLGTGIDWKRCIQALVTLFSGSPPLGWWGWPFWWGCDGGCNAKVAKVAAPHHSSTLTDLGRQGETASHGGGCVFLLYSPPAFQQAINHPKQCWVGDCLSTHQPTWSGTTHLLALLSLLVLGNSGPTLGAFWVLP